MEPRRKLNNPLASLNTRRRTLLKFGAVGAATFVLGKILGPSLNFFGGSFNWGDKEYNFQNFRVVENGKELGFYDKLGNEILVLEKD